MAKNSKEGFGEQETGNGFTYDKDGCIDLPKGEKTGCFTVDTPKGSVRGNGALGKKLPYDGLCD